MKKSSSHYNVSANKEVKMGVVKAEGGGAPSASSALTQNHEQSNVFLYKIGKE